MASIAILLACIWRGSILFYHIYTWPKVEAEIVSKEKKSGYPPFKRKEYDFARVKYIFEEHRFENEEITLKKKADVGDQITCYLDQKNPKDIEQFAPAKDAIPVIVLFSIGIALMLFHFWAMEQLSD